jgi:uncharacterized membrane protein YsdA (DUF1294 family)
MSEHFEQARHKFARAAFSIVVTTAVVVAAFVLVRYFAVR